MAGVPPGNENCLNNFLEARFVTADVRVDFAVGAFEISIGNHSGAAVAGAGNIEHIQTVLVDDTVQMRVDKVLRPGVVPQWPGRVTFMSSGRKGRFQRGLSRR